MVSEQDKAIVPDIIQKAIANPVASLGSTVLWGILEFMALQRLRREDRRMRKPGSALSERLSQPNGQGE